MKNTLMKLMLCMSMIGVFSASVWADATKAPTLSIVDVINAANTLDIGDILSASYSMSCEEPIYIIAAAKELTFSTLIVHADTGELLGKKQTQFDATSDIALQLLFDLDGMGSSDFVDVAACFEE